MLRENIPNLDRYILGIDTASIENNTEPWVFAPAYEIARDSATNKMIKHGQRKQTLGFTYHVGEDYRHILTGQQIIKEIDKILSSELLH